MPAGRPTDYRPEYCKMLQEHMSKGYSYRSFAATLRVDADTLYEWERKNQEFSEAKRIGRELALQFWESLGTGLAAGKLKGAPAVWIFNMKNRFKEDWKDRHEIDVGEKAGQILKLAYDINDSDA